MFRRSPGLFAVRFCYDIFAVGFRTVIGVALFLAALAHLIGALDANTPLQMWPVALISDLGEPQAVIGVAGFLFTGWMILFAAEALASAGVWGTLADLVRGREVRPLTTAFGRATERFADAVVVRLFTTCATVMLVSVLAGSVFGAVMVAAEFGVTVGFPTVGTAAAWALIFTLVAASVALVRLTVELVAAPLFVEDQQLGEAMLRAAGAVLRRPVFVYRLFVMAAAVLIPPLFLYYIAIMFQNVALQFDAMVGVAAILRVAADFVMLGGFAAFMVALHSMFFAYYAWAVQALDDGWLAPETSTTAPSIADIVPSRYDNIVDVDDILGDWPPDTLVDVSNMAQASSEPVPVGPFDLNAILRNDEEE